ncbi:MAG TPA: hypothetical protein ENI29_21965 [bacterium]|nr:hypothetical protein [bacterium]
MSSEIKKKKYQGPEEIIEDFFDIKTVIFPFSLMLREKEKYIYSGEEKMLFQKRHPIYRFLLLNEFSEYLIKNDLLKEGD